MWPVYYILLPIKELKFFNQNNRRENKMKKIIALVLTAVMVCGIISGCAGGSGKIKIGVIAPLTGDVAVYGTAVNNAVELYVKQLNEAGGIDGKKIELITYDDKGDPTEALNAYNKLVSADEVVAIIGPVTSTPTFGVAEKSAADGIPCITGTATHPDVTTYGDNYFRACFEDPFQGGTMAKFAKEELKATTAGIIYNSSDAYSTGLMEAFTAAAKEAGLEVVATEAYSKGDVDFKAQLTNIKKESPDVLFVPDYYNNAYLIASQVKEVGLDTTLLGVDGTDGVLEIEGADTSVFDGMYFANHYSADDTSAAVVAFRAAYEAEYDAAPNALAALGYDAADILFSAIKVASGSIGVDALTGADKKTDIKDVYAAIVDAMGKTDKDCVTGHITFDEAGNPIKDCTIIKIEGGAYHFYAKY